MNGPGQGETEESNVSQTDRVQLELAGVSKSYPGAGGEELAVLRAVDLQVRAGEAVAIMGPSGSGKSTLLNLMGGLDRPTSGRVLLEGEDLAGLSEKRLAEVRNRRIGLVFQLHHLLPQCTVLENVLIPTLVRSGSGGGQAGEAARRARELLGRVGLGGRLNHRPGELSGGERQRVAVVRALINEPAAVLADEPTGALDREAAERLAELLAELNRQEGVTLVVVTHSERLARGVCGKGRVLELADGRLRAPPGGSSAGEGRG